jgi:Calponin homology (CH) domain
MASFREKMISSQVPHGSGVVVRDSSLGRLHQSVKFGHRFSSGENQSKALLGPILDSSSSKENSSNATNSIKRPGKTPMPSTPFSILKQEIEHDDDDDQSLLCSPLVMKTRNPSRSSSSSFAAKQQPTTTTDFSNSSEDKSIQLPATRNTSGPDEVQNTQVVYTLPSPVFGESPCQPRYQSAIHPKHSETPFTVNKKGVCMDLSDVFCGAVKNSTAVKKMRPTPARPPRKPTAATTATRGEAAEESDEKSDESQEIMFTNLLNQMLCPIDDTELQSGAFHGLVIHQKLSKTRRVFRQTFRSMNLEPLKNRILSGKLKLREDRDVSADLGCRKELIELLFSYSVHWLRLGMETVFSTTFTSIDRATLRNFIITEVVQDSDILNKYTHGKCKVPSGSFEASYRDELRTAVLFRILCLVCFLDVAKSQELLDCPLFDKKAKFKSTKKLLFQFCSEFMKGEGNIVKHLGRLGLDVTVEQKATEELEFRINNIKVDLSDGIRLTRLAEILSDASLVSKLRLPVVSRLQKFHNVNLALNHLQGIPKSILAHHIIDGHRQQVLRFYGRLSRIIFYQTFSPKSMCVPKFSAFKN